MSDVQARPAAARGRGSSARGGRGGLSSRGGRGTTRSAATNGDSEHTSLPTLEDQGEIADLNKTHGSNLPVLKELFPNWSEVDLLYALKETDGDVTVTIERIAEGNISQWGEVSSQKKDRTKSKAKDTFTTTTGADGPAATRTARGGRVDGTRGRGRVMDRGGRGAIRGRSVKPATDASRAKENQPLSVPTDESNAWDTTKTNDDGGWAQAAAASSWGASAATDSTPAVTSKSAETPAPAVVPQGTQKTWASMLRQSTVPKPTPQPPKEVPVTKPEPALEPLPAAAAEPSPPAPAEAEAPTETATSAPAPVPEDEPESIAELSAEPQEEQTAADTTTVVVPEVALPPSKDQLTETNLEQVADISNPPRTDTVASEAADSWDPRAATLSATATPLSASQAQHQPHKAPASGFAATAIKATERTALPRTAPNHQRRFLDQQEAVRMPVAANQQLERTTLQFGAFNLNGGEDDIDGDREEPETRAQPPGDSPVTQPRASLPPAPQAVLPETYSAQKTVPALPSGPNSAVAQATPTAPAVQQTGSQAAAPQPPTQPAAQQFGRFGQTTSQEQSPFPQKPFDTYNQGTQPSAAQSHLDNFPGQQPSQAQPQTQQPGGAYSSAADQYSSYYTADQQSRLPYSFYGQGYGQQQQQQQQQQAGQGQQEGGLGSRAGFGAYGASQADLASQYPQSTNQSRFGTAVAQDPSSGNTTPNPSSTQTQQPTSQTHPQSHVGQQQHGNQYFGQQPYYGGYYSANYMNNQYGYGGFGPYGKGGVYGQPHHYGMSQQSPYDHGSSAASGYPQSTLHRADSGAASGLGDYGRAGSAQSAAQPGLAGSGGFGGIHDAFGRGASTYGAQTGQAFNAPSTQPSGAASGNEDLKPFNDTKTAGGPSPSLASSGRPGSATNTAPSQTSLPPPQSAQPGMGGYGGYPSHLSHGLHSQSGSTGYGMAAGPAQGHQNSPYSGYGGFGGGNSYYGSQQSRHGGWGSNYSGGNGF